ncbi:MAG: cysteine desulfurase family protein, partial [Patescibacteria group bacterium]|nr:cysteine desulfurase family protein [Patescibacteria group bacterium]
MSRPSPANLVYLDNNATTPMDPRVIEHMAGVMRCDYGNPASTHHALGRRAAELVEHAREQVARLIGAAASEIVFTSGATESCNLAIKGVVAMYARRGNHVVTCLGEHKAVLEPLQHLERHGLNVTRLAPDAFGRVSAGQVEVALTGQTLLISIMAANNVVGSTNPIGEIGRVAKRRGVLFHCDATQAVGRTPIDVTAMEIDLLSLSAHKFHGPKGVGALWVRGQSPRVRLAAQIDGGGQENGLRGGTLNVPGIAGMGLACELARNELEADAQRVKALRDRLFAGLANRLCDVVLNGHPSDRLPNTLNVSFLGVEATELIARLPEIAASVGAACTSDEDDPHYVLRAMGLAEDRMAGSVRFSLGRFTTQNDIDHCIQRVVDAVDGLRDRHPQPPTRCACPAGCCTTNTQNRTLSLETPILPSSGSTHRLAALPPREAMEARGTASRVPLALFGP